MSELIQQAGMALSSGQFTEAMELFDQAREAEQTSEKQIERARARGITNERASARARAARRTSERQSERTSARVLNKRELEQASKSEM